MRKKNQEKLLGRVEPEKRICRARSTGGGILEHIRGDRLAMRPRRCTESKQLPAACTYETKPRHKKFLERQKVQQSKVQRRTRITSPAEGQSCELTRGRTSRDKNARWCWRWNIRICRAGVALAQTCRPWPHIAGPPIPMTHTQ